MRRRLGAILLIACLFTATFAVALENTDFTATKSDSVTEDASVTNLHFWYTDEAMTDYLNSAALEYYEQTGIKVSVEYKTGLEYIEEINDATLHTSEGPDAFLVSNDSLEKAYLTGLAAEISDPEQVVNDTVFPKTSINAISYQGKKVAYPMYFETSALIYNKTYLAQMAAKIVEAEIDAEEGEAAQAQYDTAESTAEGSDAEDAAVAETESEGAEPTEEQLLLNARIENKMAELIPNSMDEILEMADEYDLEEGMEGYLLWDVSDIFYNYFFLGDYIVVGGEAGDDISQVNIYNDQTIDCLNVYQRLNQFFSIDAQSSNYSQVVQDFIDGKYLFTIATTDIIETLETAKAEDRFPYEYGVTLIPAVSDGTYFVEEFVEDEDGNAIEADDADSTVRTIAELNARGLSVTYAIAVNGFSAKQNAANDFATFLSTKYLDTLYSRTGKMACSYLQNYELEAMQGFIDEYEKSISMPKVTQLANFWLQLEVCFTEVWLGEDTSEELKKVEEQIMLQLPGIQ